MVASSNLAVPTIKIKTFQRFAERFFCWNDLQTAENIIELAARPGGKAQNEPGLLKTADGFLVIATY